MPGIFGSEAFSFEYMPQVSIAIIAYYFYPVAISIGQVSYCVGNLVVEAGPAAAGTELVFRII